MKIYMMMLLLLLSVTSSVAKQTSLSLTQPVFELVVLGETGGIHDGNISAFLLRTLSANKYIALDAGTLVNGINKSIEKGAFAHVPLSPDNEWSLAGNILRNHIQGYLISHSHLDHVSGLLIASPEDSSKPIYALPSVNQHISETYFNWQAWANFADRGKSPQLGKYPLVDLAVGKVTSIKNTPLKVTAFSLSHPLESTAFVIEHEKNLFVYFGDTGPDEVEKQGKLGKVWQYLAKQMRTKQLRGIVIEVSFPNDRPNELLFGHLTPKWLMLELAHFNSLLDKKHSLKQIKVVISHIKPSLKSGANPKAQIIQQLNQGNNLGVKIIIPKQGQRIEF